MGGVCHVHVIDEQALKIGVNVDAIQAVRHWPAAVRISVGLLL